MATFAKNLSRLAATKSAVAGIILTALIFIALVMKPDRLPVFIDFLHNESSSHQQFIETPRGRMQSDSVLHNISTQADTTAKGRDSQKVAGKPTLTLNGIGLPSNQKPDFFRVKPPRTFLGNRFSSRNQLVADVCSKLTVDDLKAIDRKSGEKKSFANSRYTWCSVPKVGSTFLRSINKKINDKTFEKEKKSKSNARRRKAFFLVREPYSRMVSGYIGKIVTNQPWWQAFGRPILGMFRANATDKEKRCGNGVTFPEFVKYFIFAQEKGWRRNPHFVPMYELCDPCMRTYDFIVHLETVKDDVTYLLQSVNITANLDFSDEEMTLKGKCRAIVKQKSKVVQCQSMCAALREVWWSFQARGLVSVDFHFPLDEKRCSSISGEEFADLAWDSHVKSVGRIDKRKQKRQALVDLFLQVPLEDRIKVRDLLALDFKLFGYDQQPDDLFPELVNNKSEGAVAFK